MAALRSMDVAKLKEDLPETHGEGTCVWWNTKCYRRDRVNTSLFQAWVG